MIPYNKKLTSNSRSLRKNMTPEEKHLWYDFLRYLPFTVHRQHNIENYIVDFYIAKKKMVIELDGSQHTSPEGRREDAERDSALARFGIQVLRYPNDTINNDFLSVTKSILGNLGIGFDDLKINDGD